MAISTGSSAATHGELAMLADEMPNKEATGLAQTPAHAPALQHERRTGAVEVKPPVTVVHIDFLMIFSLLKLAMLQWPTMLQ
jgi:hypothetical protein